MSNLQFNVSIKLDVNEMTHALKPAQIAAVLNGVAKLVAVENSDQPAKREVRNCVCHQGSICMCETRHHEGCGNDDQSS